MRPKKRGKTKSFDIHSQSWMFFQGPSKTNDLPPCHNKEALIK